MKILRRLLAFVLLVALLWASYRFAQANAGVILIDLIYLKLPEAPLWMVLVATFGLGAALATLLLLYPMAKQGLVTRRYRKTVRGLESEIHQLRNLPLAGGEGAGSELLTADAERRSAAGPSA
jgi:hypothetical protein